MQGIIYTVLSDMVIEKFGVLFWDEMLQELNPSSHGVYTTGQQYNDDELLSMVAYLSEKAQIPVPDLVRAYGEYLFTHLFNSLPENYPHKSDLKTFLLSVDKVIHKEVKRLYPGAYLPQFENKVTENTLTMNYYSKRKLCAAAEGLILGAAKRFNQPVKVSQPTCMHCGAEHCEIVVEFLSL
ncbi:heme NO-binding domain-containing protein [Vibrio mimicus]